MLAAAIEKLRASAFDSAVCGNAATSRAGRPPAMVRRRLQSRQSLVHGLMRGLQDVDGVDGLGVNPGNGELERRSSVKAAKISRV